MDELILTRVRKDLARGSQTICFLGINTDIKQITHGGRVPCAPVGVPFLDWSPEELYEYWKANTRGDLDTIKNRWTTFTFTILDENSANNQDLLMCSDGPDFREGDAVTGRDEIKLKCIRMKFSHFVMWMPGLETLTNTPSEVNKEICLKAIPPVIINPEYLGAMQGKLATLNEMRRNKRQVIWKAEADGWLETHG